MLSAKKEEEINFVAWFCDWLKAKAIDNVLDETTESFDDLLYRFVNEVENDNDEGEIDTYNLGKFLYELFKEQW